MTLYILQAISFHHCLRPFFFLTCAQWNEYFSFVDGQRLACAIFSFFLKKFIYWGIFYENILSGCHSSCGRGGGQRSHSIAGAGTEGAGLSWKGGSRTHGQGCGSHKVPCEVPRESRMQSWAWRALRHHGTLRRSRHRSVKEGRLSLGRWWEVRCNSLSSLCNCLLPTSTVHYLYVPSVPSDTSRKLDE